MTTLVRVLIAEPAATLRGRVDSAGAPVAGATVMVYRAFPITGVAYYCPSCYLDCGRRTRTDEHGDWTIEGLDDTLKFELLVVAKGHLAARTVAINPAKGMPVEVSLTPRDPEALPPDRVVRGRVLDAAGEPVEGAIVVPEMVMTATGGCGGLCDGLDPLDVTDEDGRFALTYKEPIVGMNLSVSARGFARTCFMSRPPGAHVHELRVGEGAGVAGRLVRDGTPVPGVEVTLVADQSGGRVCFDRQVIATDEKGGFAFAGVLPGQRYVLTASTSQLGGGCTPPRVIGVEREGQEVEVGDVAVVRGVRVSGRVLPPEGGRIPPGAKLSLSVANAWDGLTVDLGEDGAFEFGEAAPGEFSISLHAPGIFVSHRNPSADRLNENMLVGRIDADLRGLLIETTTKRPPRPRHDDPPVPPELGGIEGRAR
ncbi:MAG: carboxypeptidase regulatory-like domain-containing protein [Phycisphaerae bacterium]|nr:carboxypeptidase regulatory-like domain-containing protein [Phycisphaerae bacterium]